LKKQKGHQRCLYLYMCSCIITIFITTRYYNSDIIIIIVIIIVRHTFYFYLLRDHILITCIFT